MKCRKNIVLQKCEDCRQNFKRNLDGNLCHSIAGHKKSCVVWRQRTNNHITSTENLSFNNFEDHQNQQIFYDDVSITESLPLMPHYWFAGSTKYLEYQKLLFQLFGENLFMTIRLNKQNNNIIDKAFIADIFKYWTVHNQSFPQGDGFLDLIHKHFNVALPKRMSTIVDGCCRGLDELDRKMTISIPLPMQQFGNLDNDG